MDANAALNGGDASAALNGVPSDLSRNYSAAHSRYQSDLNAENAAQQPAIKKFQDTASSPIPAPPLASKASPAPDAQSFNKDAQGWVSALAVLSSLIGSRGRARGTGALKAFAGGMKGIQEGNQQAFENSYKTWKGETEAMFKEHDEEMKKYEDILKNRDMTESEQIQEINMIGHEYQNKLTMDAKDLGQAGAMVDSALKASLKAKEVTEKVKAKADAKIDADKSSYEKWKESPSAKKDAESWNEGLPIAGLIRGRGASAEQHLEFIKQYAAELDPKGDRVKATEDYNAAYKAVNSFGSGKQGDIVRSFNVAYNHADLVSNLADALGNGDVQRINALSQQFSQEFGSPAPTNFDAAKHILADEINKAAIGGAGALADRQALTANIQRASSPEQIHGQIATYKNLIVGQMKGMKQQYEQATKRDDFDRLLSPEVREDLKAHSQENGSSPAGAAPDFSHLWSGGE